MIPTKRNRRTQRPVGGVINVLRHRVERIMGQPKNARRVATRYWETATSDLGGAFGLVQAFSVLERACPLKV